MTPYGGEQVAWLDRRLAKRRDRPHLVGAHHVPLYPATISAEGGGHGGRKELVPLFEKHNVDFVLEHHAHVYKRTHPLKYGLSDKGGIVYLGDGSWGALRALDEGKFGRHVPAASKDTANNGRKSVRSAASAAGSECSCNE